MVGTSDTLALAGPGHLPEEHDSDCCQLFKLDDACLLNVMRFLEPLPDLFALQRSCWHFRRLMNDQRMWLVVSQDPTHYRCAMDKLGNTLAGRHFKTVKAAVQASRPGDTVYLAPGSHAVDEPVVVQHPLHFLGGGSTPEQTLITSSRAVEQTLDVRATCRVANFAITSTCGPCIAHRAGQLQVERCILSVRAGRSLAHCLAPIETYACVSLARQALSGHPLMPAALRAGAGPGKLTVCESQMHGGSTAVFCRGTGALRDVRVIYQRASPMLYWMGVDCNVPGHYMPAAAVAMHLQPAVVSGDKLAACDKLALTVSADQQEDAGCADALETKASFYAEADSVAIDMCMHGDDTPTPASLELRHLERLGTQQQEVSSAPSPSSSVRVPAGLHKIAKAIASFGEQAVQRFMQGQAHVQTNARVHAVAPSNYVGSSAAAALHLQPQVHSHLQQADGWDQATSTMALQQHGVPSRLHALAPAGPQPGPGSGPEGHGSAPLVTTSAAATAVVTAPAAPEEAPLYNHLMLPYEHYVQHARVPSMASQSSTLVMGEAIQHASGSKHACAVQASSSAHVHGATPAAPARTASHPRVESYINDTAGLGVGGGSSAGTVGSKRGAAGLSPATCKRPVL